MIRLLYNAREELKRAGHMIVVSLKYTRTVDVIRNIIRRLINAYHFMFQALLKKALEDKKIKKIPEQPLVQINLIKELYKDDKEITRYVNIYELLRQIEKAKYKKINEYRRHVTMIVDIKGKEINMDIDKMTEYYIDAKECFVYIENLLFG